MSSIYMDNQLIEQCSSCGGSYYDEGELEAILDVFQYYESIYISEEEIDTIPDKDEKRRLRCPKDDAVMEPEEAAAIVIDRCATCGGIWLDEGELTALRLAQKNIKENLSLYIRLGL